MSYHSYAEDTQVYQIIKPQGDNPDLSKPLEKNVCLISGCTNMLQINLDKTEIIIFVPYSQVKRLFEIRLSFA